MGVKKGYGDHQGDGIAEEGKKNSQASMESGNTSGKKKNLSSLGVSFSGTALPKLHG